MPAPPDRAAARAAGRLVLAVDDHATNRAVIERQLARLGFAADIVESAQAALEAHAREPYGLVIADIQMPEMDGLELTAAIRALERRDQRRRVPIVALTANAMQEEAQRCLAAGMDDYLSKPVSLTQLNDALRRWLGEPPPVGAGAPAATDPAGPVPGSAPADGADLPVLDLAHLREMLGEIDQTALDLLDRFVDTVRPQIDGLSEAVTARTAFKTASLAHAVKGAARNAGAFAVGRLAERIEDLAKSDDWAGAATLLPELAAAFAQAAAMIAATGLDSGQPRRAAGAA
jgi:CheY-like chemotaxis protein/HPt (histidine-containing phosphotransfer) domain-containing protein